MTIPHLIKGVSNVDDLFDRVNALITAQTGVELPVVAAPFDIWMVAGQSLSIGTLNPAFNVKPPQPQIPSNFKMFNQVGSTGVQDRALIPSDINELVAYQEQGESGMASYYTLGTTFLAGTTTKETAWIPAGKGGGSIENIGKDGSYACYANQQAMLARLKVLQSSATVKGIIFIHGGANYQDTKQEYYDKMVAFLADQISAIQAEYPNQTPPLYIYQHGGERITDQVQQAQLQMAKDGLAVCVGATYWLNRQHPNTSEGLNGSTNFERIHLNPLGYQYLGDMFKRAVKLGTSFKPLHVESYEWVTTKQLKLHVHNPEIGSTLVIDTTQPFLPAFAGSGIEVERPNGELFPATNVTVNENTITVDFAGDVLIGDRIRLGFTPEDMKYDGEFAPNPAIGSYPSAMIGTNIRGSKSLPASLGNDDYYDWLAVDSIDTEALPSSPVVARGNNCWKTGATQGIAGWGSSRTFLGGVMTVVTDGISEEFPISRSLQNAGTNKEHSTWNIKAARTFEFTANAAIDTDIAYYQVFIGGAGTNIAQSDIVDGKVTLQLTATIDFDIRVALKERTGEDITAFTGHLSDIEIREVFS